LSQREDKDIKETLCRVPAGFGRRGIDVLKFFDNGWWKNSGCCDRIDTNKASGTDNTTEALG